jgi:hypothetical protein
MMSKRSEQAAKRFYGKLGLPESWDYGGHPVKTLIWSAFFLYETAWDCHDVRKWTWPFNVLKEGGSFDGGEPWSILLRKAVELSQTKRSP